ncbi:hypothetical protein DFH08DRAFT_814787 [Mycena albidolilacea]|uniref:Uncharacterized protein n=1 Tax=Mycena albidolilacea TaxID=1033008 RepID=A0AAD7ELI2_9AGAR|nr:hypothetical protein DFH08DRAFT_814787 [Mycena albidolilacea]
MVAGAVTQPPVPQPPFRGTKQLGNIVGPTGLTVQKLLNAPSTVMAYGGGRVADNSPAYVNKRKVRDTISRQQKVEHPLGMSWEGVLHELNVRERSLAKEDRYIHTAMSKNGFRLVVTMHPYIVMFIHKILSLNIDYTFSRVDGDMDKWEVAGFLDRLKHRLTFASLYCDKKDRTAFTQLFRELFDTIHLVTGEQLKIRPFYPDANCWVVIMDGEVPQAQAFGDFLSDYNNPEISNIFYSHIDELGPQISQPIISRLRSIMGLQTQAEIDEWHQFCKEQTEPAITNWYAHKLANPWILPSINKFLSKIAPSDWDLTPNHSNYVETAHAGRNAETSVGVGLLTAILQAKERDNIKARELAQIQHEGVMGNRWNGSAEREKLSSQRKAWKMRSATIRNDQLTNYETLKAERDSGVAENKASLARQKELESQIKALQAEIALDKHRTDLPAQVLSLRRDVTEEKALQSEWGLRRTGPLAGIRINRRRPGIGQEPTSSSSTTPLVLGDQPLSEVVATNSMVVASEATGMVNQMDLLPLFGDSILNLPLASGQYPQDSSMDLDLWLSSNPPEFDPHVLDEFMASFDPLSAIYPDPGPAPFSEGYNANTANTWDVVAGTALAADDDQLEYIGPAHRILNFLDPQENWNLNRASQELPPLPPPRVMLSPLPSEPEERIPNAEGSDQMIAPRDIDLSFSEHNILVGKHQHTKSTRAADAAEARPTKKGLR